MAQRNGKTSLKEGKDACQTDVKNQITLPKTVMARFGSVEYFDVSTDGGDDSPASASVSRVEEVRTRLAHLGVDEQDVAAAVAWARQPE